MRLKPRLHTVISSQPGARKRPDAWEAVVREELRRVRRARVERPGAARLTGSGGPDRTHLA